MISVKRYTIKRLRLEKALTAAELASQAGISRTAMVAIETGNRTPRLTTLRAIAGALGVEPTHLYDIDVPEDDGAEQVER